MNRLWIPLCVAAATMALPSSASAQDVGSAFDMGQLTGSLSQDHITQVERARAGGRGPRSTSATAAKARQTCASVPSLQRRYGRSDPRLVRLVGMCRQAGY